MAFIRWEKRGHQRYAWLVASERVAGKVRQKRLKYLGKDPQIDDRLIAEVEEEHPGVVDWEAIRESLAVARQAPPEPAVEQPVETRAEPEEDWTDEEEPPSHDPCLPNGGIGWFPVPEGRHPPGVYTWHWREKRFYYKPDR